MSVQLTPHFGNVQAHYDLSDDFFRLFLDPTQTYSCAYFERDDMTLQEAQIAKIDLALGKLNLEPGMTLLDIGCGWGATMRRAIEKYDVNVVGLTLSENQAGHVQKMFDQMDTPAPDECCWRDGRNLTSRRPHRLDRRVRALRPPALPPFLRGDPPHVAGRRQDVAAHHRAPHLQRRQGKGLTLTHELVHFTKFILAEIFPGGWLPSIPTVHEYAEKVGFRVTAVQSLQLHYARTLDMWATALEANKDQAIAIQSQTVYDRYMKYLTGCAKLFRQGYTDVDQFTLEK